jgi:hypothetical protein
MDRIASSSETEHRRRAISTGVKSSGCVEDSAVFL